MIYILNLKFKNQASLANYHKFIGAVQKLPNTDGAGGGGGGVPGVVAICAEAVEAQCERTHGIYKCK